jgi:hypothetical protein
MLSFIRHHFQFNRQAFLPIDPGATEVARAGRRKVTLTTLAALGLAGGACGPVGQSGDVSQTEATEDISASSQALNILSTRLLSKPNIEVCWESVGWPKEQEWVRETVRRTWERWTNATFTGWRSCATSASAGSAIRIAVRDTEPGVFYGGGSSLVGKPNGMVLNFTFAAGYRPECAAKRRTCIEALAVHEFGHVLGFVHEQNRDDTPANCTKPPQGADGDTVVGDWDVMSIMNYCNPQRWTNNGIKLSVTDIEGARRFYGHSLGPEQQFLALDLQGDGRDHIVQTYRGWTGTANCGMRNQFTPWECKGQASTVVDWGTQEQRFLGGDFNGDGRGDTVQVYRKAKSIPRCLSTGNGWSCSQSPVTFQDWGTAEQRFLAADFTGDGRTDLLQVYRGASTIPRCAATDQGWTCTNPAAAIQNSGSPEQVFLMGDLNKDRKADVIQAFRSWKTLPVCLADSTGWSCSSSSARIVDSGSAEQEFHVGDVDRDGRSDVIVTYRGWPFMTQCLATGLLNKPSWNCTDFPADVVDSGSPEQQFLTGDFNGDGRTDVVQAYRGWSNLPLCLATATGWYCSKPQARIVDWGSDEQRFMTADVNHDGKTDIVQVFRGASTYPVCLSTGSGWHCYDQSATIFDIQEY